MKRLSLLLVATLVALVSCEKALVDDTDARQDAVASGVVFNLSATHPDGGGTKAVKTAWETGDVVFVFLSDCPAPAYLELKFDGSTWVNTPKNSLSVSDGDSGTMTAVFLPFGSGATVSNDGTAFVFDETYLSYYLTAQLPYTVSGGEISGTFDMQIPNGYVQFFLDDASADPATEIELREPLLAPQGIASVAADGSITLTDQVWGAPLPGYVYDKEVKTGSDAKGYLFSGVIASEATKPQDYHFTVVSGGWEGSYYLNSFAGKILSGSGTTGRAVKLPDLSTWIPVTDYKPIDLGIDSDAMGVKRRIYWSSRNLGASAETVTGDTDAARQATWGDYFAWGETEPYYSDGAYSDTPTWKSGKEAGYSMDSYKYGEGDDYTLDYAFTKYCSDPAYGKDGFTDGKTVLDPEDDAATNELGGRWRTPSDPDWYALDKNTTWTYDAAAKGQVVTSKVPGYTDRSIFLPMAGQRIGLTLVDIGSPATETDPETPPTGRYLTSSMGSSDYLIYHFGIGRSTHFSSEYLRSVGYSLRPVSD